MHPFKPVEAPEMVAVGPGFVLVDPLEDKLAGWPDLWDPLGPPDPEWTERIEGGPPPPLPPVWAAGLEGSLPEGLTRGIPRVW